MSRLNHISTPGAGFVTRALIGMAQDTCEEVRVGTHDIREQVHLPCLVWWRKHLPGSPPRPTVNSIEVCKACTSYEWVTPLHTNWALIPP